MVGWFLTIKALHHTGFSLNCVQTIAEQSANSEGCAKCTYNYSLFYFVGFSWNCVQDISKI